MASAELVGHERQRGLLARAVRDGRVPPALLFTGPEGVGKKSVALAVARALLCARADGGACDACEACGRALRGLHPDARLIRPEGASVLSIKIEAVRDVVREIVGRPFEGRARAFVIDEAHLMTEQAGNALLKSLEEPPPTSHVILVSGAPQALLPTVRSRCQLLRFGPLPAGLLESHLRERHGLGAEEARLRATLSGGSLGAALAFDSDSFRAVRDETLELLERIASWSPLERMEASERLADQEDLALALTALRSLLRDIAVARAAGGPQALLNADRAERLAALARGPLGDAATTLGESVGESRNSLRGNANKLLAMDVLLDALAAAPSRG
jgi:DNA polymerase-3 subunit delta'